MSSESYDYLASMPHFSILPVEELQRVSEVAVHTDYAKGTIIAEQDKTKLDSIYVVKSGVIELFDEKKGARMHSGLITTGEVFGGITIMMNGGISLRTAIIDEACSGIAIPKDVFQSLCRRHKVFYEYFLENFSKNILDKSLNDLVETGQMSIFLAGLDPFSFLSEDEIKSFAGDLSVVKYPKGTVLFVQGRTRIGHVYILQKGSAERYYEEGVKKTMHGILSEGDIYGGISILLNDGISVRTLRVIEDSIFYLLPRKIFLDICEKNDEFATFFTDTFGKRMLEKSYAAIISKTTRPHEEGLLFFNQPISNIYKKKVILGETNLTIREAAQLMSASHISSLFLKNEKGQCEGVVTERDLARKVISKGYDINRPVAEVMSSPVHTVSSQALVFEALMSMMQAGIRHIGITNDNGDIEAIVSNRDILEAQGQSPIFLLREISGANSMAQIIEQHDKLPRQIRSLIAGGAKASNLTRFITAISDTILEKVIQFALNDLGPPPKKFVFMIMGSEGRNEQTLKTDQDNAIIFEDVPEKQKKMVRNYFLKFGDRVCTLLDQAGYAFCSGNVMAKNPKWCQPLLKWKSYFSDWIYNAEGEGLLRASIFFDFRGAYGNMELIENLQKYLFNTLGNWPGFFRHLSENALYFKPPLGFFRNFVVESKGEHKDKFDIKKAMQPIVDFARIYALKNKIEETNTLERLEQLRFKKVLKPDEYDELEKAYSFLLQTRFVRQVTSVVEEKGTPDNYVNPKQLTRIEQKMLKEIFNRIAKFQSKLEFDFIGPA